MYNQRDIQLLDCTLRDGGHINQGYFGKEVIINTIRKLIEAKIDIIEVGFLWDHQCDENTARFYTIEDVKRILPEDRGESHFSLMADFIDLEHIEPCDGTVEYIRLSFKRHRWDWALSSARILMDKGYKVYINPVNNNVYTDEQYLEAIRKVNELHPYGFSIVDTFGVMRLRDLIHRYSLVENNLDKDITIGLHLHENLGLAYSLAQQFLQLANPKRKINIDGSLLGMGRIPGNLCIEQILDHLNYEYGCNYNPEPIFDAIDDYIAPIKAKIPWGYAIPYALSAKYNLHRTYAEFLIDKWKLRTSDIERILSLISKNEAELFNEEYIETIYREYMSVKVDDTDAKRKLSSDLIGRSILLIAPGASINDNKIKIQEYVKREKPVVFGVHCIPDFIDLDYEFYSNIKRYEVLHTDEKIKCIVSSNLARYYDLTDYLVINYAQMAYHNGEYSDDSVLMVLNLLKEIGITNIAIAGFDGVRNGKGNFYINILSRSNRPDDYSDNILKVLKHNYSDIKISFLTDSYYKNYNDSRLRNE